MVIKLMASAPDNNQARLDLMKVVHPALPFSLVDIMAMSRVTFPGSNVSTDAKTGSKATAHAQGRAIDFSLAPYYAVTGLALKNLTTGGGKHVLNPDFNGATHSAIPEYMKEIYRTQLLTTDMLINGTKQKTGTRVSNIPLNGLEPVVGSEGGIQNIFDATLSKANAPTGLVVVATDLEAADRVWYHFPASTVSVAPPAGMGPLKTGDQVFTPQQGGA